MKPIIESMNYYPVFDVTYDSNRSVYRMHGMRVKVKEPATDGSSGPCIDEGTCCIDMDGLNNVSGVELEHSMGYNVIIIASADAMKTILAPDNVWFSPSTSVDILTQVNEINDGF